MLSFGTSKQVSGEAVIIIKANSIAVFSFVAENFFHNYQKWAPEVVELEPLDGDKVFVGAKGRQVREDNDALIESIFEITEFCPYSLFVMQGMGLPYKQTYLIEDVDKSPKAKLIFKFDLLEIEIYMRPFEKLIRVAIEEGAENTVVKISDLTTAQQARVGS